MCANGCTSIPNFDCECNCSTSSSGLTSNYHYVSGNVNVPENLINTDIDVGASFTPGTAGVYEVTLCLDVQDINNVGGTKIIKLKRNGAVIKDQSNVDIQFINFVPSSKTYVTNIGATQVNSPLQLSVQSDTIGVRIYYTLTIKRIA